MAKEFFKATTILDPIEFWGNWGIPQNDKLPEELPGMFQFQTNSHGKLVVCGNFKDIPLRMMDTYPVFWGTIFYSNKKVSIFDAFVSNIVLLPVQKNQPITLSFSEYWEGDVFFKNRDDVKFKEVSFGINNLEVWHNSNPYETSWPKRGTNIKTNYRRPSGLDLFEDENVTIKLGYNVEGPGMGYGQTVFSIKQSARIVITSKRGRLLPYYGKTHSFQYYINLIFCFFSLLIGKNTFIYDIRGTVKKTRRQKGKVIWGIHATRYWRRGIANAHLKELNFLDVSLPYYLIKTQLKKVIYQYNLYHSKIFRFVYELIEYQNRQHPIDHHLLPQLVFLFEGIIRDLYPKEVEAYHKEIILTDEYEEMKNSILAICNKQQQGWLKRQLPSYPKFREYYDVALREIGDLFPYMLEEYKKGRTLADDMFIYIQAERAKTAHATNGVDADSQLYINTIYWLHTFLVVAIWKGCGVDMSFLTEKRWPHHVHDDHMKEIFRALLPTMSNEIKKYNKR